MYLELRPRRGLGQKPSKRPGNITLLDHSPPLTNYGSPLHFAYRIFLTQPVLTPVDAASCSGDRFALPRGRTPAASTGSPFELSSGPYNYSATAAVRANQPS
jgi:hypothetical protein